MCHENCLCPFSHHRFHHFIVASIIHRVSNLSPMERVRGKKCTFSTLSSSLSLLIKHFMGRDAICRHPISESLCHKNCLELWNRKKTDLRNLPPGCRLHFGLRCIQMLQKGIYCLQTAAEMETGPTGSLSFVCVTCTSQILHNQPLIPMEQYGNAKFG